MPAPETIPAAAAPGILIPGFNAETTSDGSGAFAFTGVPPGFHQICVDSPDPLHLNPCHWSLTQGRLALDANAVAPPLQVERGHLVTITVDDPRGLLAARNLNRAHPALDEEIQVSIRSPQLGHIALRPRPGQGRQRVFQVVVPFETAVPLNITGDGGIKFADQVSNRTSARVSQTLRIRRGSAPGPFTFRLDPR